jgi:four helix bundle protein
MRNFRELKVWHKAHQLTLAVYRATATYPREEQYGLISQTRRASVSIAANIAEGCARGSNADYARFMQFAVSSASELEYHLLLGHDLGYLDSPTHQPLAALVIEVKKMLTVFIQRLRANR